MPPGSAKPVMEDRSIRPNIVPITQVVPGVVCLRAKMFQEYEGTPDRILQNGLLGDEQELSGLSSGRMKTLSVFVPDRFMASIMLLLTSSTTGYQSA